MLLRSLLFSASFYIVTTLMAVFCLPMMLLGPFGAKAVMRAWTRTIMWLHRTITGIGHEFRGWELLPEGSCLIAAKHQSTWETLALVPKLSNPAFILKRELMWIPVFGWWMAMAGMIPIDRGKGASSLRKMTERAKAAIAEGRQIIIFPEGTRRPAGAPPDYKNGYLYLYKTLNVPLVPLALNSGIAWPRRAWPMRRGRIVAQVLDPIEPSHPISAVHRLVQDMVDSASDMLLLESADRGDDLPDMARRRVAELRASPPPPAAPSPDAPPSGP